MDYVLFGGRGAISVCMVKYGKPIFRHLIMGDSYDCNKAVLESTGMKYFSVYSFTLCVIAVVLQLFEIWYRVAVQDFSAIMDTIGAVTVASVILLTVTVLLNGIGIALCRGRN